MNKSAKIKYYDLTDIRWSSYYIHGLIENRNHFNYKFIVSHSIPPLLKNMNLDKKWIDILFSICIFKFQDN